MVAAERLTSDQRKQAMAHAALRFAVAVRKTFPVGGLPWPKADVDRIDGKHPVVRAAKRLAKCWSDSTTKTAVWHMPLGGDPRPLNYLRANVFRILELYGWWQFAERLEDFLRLEEQKWPWAWPDVPIVPPQMLDGLEQAARSVLADFSPHQGAHVDSPTGVNAHQLPAIENPASSSEEAPEGQFFTREQTARYLHVTPDRVSQMIRERKLEAQRNSGRPLISFESVAVEFFRRHITDKIPVPAEYDGHGNSGSGIGFARKNVHPTGE